MQSTRWDRLKWPCLVCDPGREERTAHFFVVLLLFFPIFRSPRERGKAKKTRKDLAASMHVFMVPPMRRLVKAPWKTNWGIFRLQQGGEGVWEMEKMVRHLLCSLRVAFICNFYFAPHDCVPLCGSVCVSICGNETNKHVLVSVFLCGVTLAFRIRGSSNWEPSVLFVLVRVGIHPNFCSQFQCFVCFFSLGGLNPIVRYGRMLRMNLSFLSRNCVNQLNVCTKHV